MKIPVVSWLFLCKVASSRERPEESGSAPEDECRSQQRVKGALGMQVCVGTNALVDVRVGLDKHSTRNLYTKQRMRSKVSQIPVRRSGLLKVKENVFKKGMVLCVSSWGEIRGMLVLIYAGWI